MDYRELPRIVAPDDGGDDLGPRPRRFHLARPGRLDVRKVATFVMLAVSLAAVVFYAGRHAVESALEWLSAQPRYQLAFVDIRLPEPPPDCFRGGAAAFLDRVRRNSKEPEVLSLLKVDPVRLRSAFKSFPWVAEVGEIERPPGGLVVHLRYRTPVARVSVPGAGRYFLDREGCLLPQEDIDEGSVPRLIWIVGVGLTAPPKERAGTIWRTTIGDAPDREPMDRGVVQAAKLAGFFLDRGREAEGQPDEAVRAYAITVTNPGGTTVNLIVETVQKVWIHWGRGPGDEELGELKAAEKWDLLVRQAREGLEPRSPRDSWTFGRNGLVYRPAPPARP